MASGGVLGVDKQAWLANHFRCISCGAAGLIIESDRAVCRECEVPFERIKNAVSVLTEGLRRDSGLFETENISYRNYDGNAEYILHHIEQNGGMILDCGSGQKNLTYVHLVQLEIVNY